MKAAFPQAKNILAPLGVTAAASAIDAGIQNKIMLLDQQLFQFQMKKSMTQ